MRILFVHQNFPGQYRHVVRALAAQGGHQLVALGIHEATEPIPAEVTYVRYPIERGNGADVHRLAMEIESKTIRAEACARSAVSLREQGFTPDLICGHPGWGEMLFLKEVWPTTPVLSYQEFYYRSEGFDCDFDPEFQPQPNWERRAVTRMKNAAQLLYLDGSDWCVCPTAFQKSSFPAEWCSRISVIHEGINTEVIKPDPTPVPLTLADGTVLEKGQPIVTFVNRTLEPYRGCHTFIRAIPAIQERWPEARIVAVGQLAGSSYGKAPGEGTWKDHFLREIDGRYDPSRVHFTGSLPYGPFLHLLKLSAAHVYLTYPFVMSWSLLEAMASGCAVVGSATGPVQEVISHGRNGLLVDFFKPDDLAAAVVELLGDRERAAAFGVAARQTVLERYSLSRCLPLHLALMQLVASRVLPA